MRLIFALVLMLGLGGCQILNAPPLAPRLPASGAWLVLHQDLDVPIGMARVHIQYGRVVSEPTVDLFHPYCQFQTWDLSTAERPLRIRADRFLIERAWLDRHSVAARPQHFASLRLSDVDDSPSKLTLATEMQLASSSQPGVYRLSCRYWADPQDPYLSLAEVRAALGTIASIE